MKKSPVACFDIDGTMFRSSLLIELVEQFIKEEVFPADAKDDYYTQLQSWQAREGSYEAYIDALVTSFREHLKGVHYGDLADIGRRVVAVQSKHVYRYTRDLLADLQQQGYYTIAISQSPKTILDEFCAQYGFDKAYGRIYEIGPQDRFTGVCSDEHLIQNKANILKRALERNPEIDATHSIAVGDTEGDIPLLESVSRAICFNPNQRLYTHAQRMNWEVVVERKDVIYQL